MSVVRGKKPTVAQAKLLQREVGEKWKEYLYRFTKMVDPDDSKRRLSKEGDKVRVVTFVNKYDGSELILRDE